MMCIFTCIRNLYHICIYIFFELCTEIYIIKIVFDIVLFKLILKLWHDTILSNLEKINNKKKDNQSNV